MTSEAGRERIGYLAPPGTFSHEALVDAIGERDAHLVPYPTIAETVLAVERGESDRALVPIENAIEGSVTETLDTLVHEAPGTVIVGELIAAIDHCLIAASRLSLSEITDLISHPQPLAQCARFIRAELGAARTLSATSTASAVREAIRRGDGHAAIGSRIAAETYGGVILAEGIADELGNETRFVWLAREETPNPAWLPTPSTPANKTSVVFAGFNDTSPGALVSILQEFSIRSINLTKIESRPQRRRLGHYLFFADLEGAVDVDPVAAALDAVTKKVEQLRVLGSYHAATPGSPRTQ